MTVLVTERGVLFTPENYGKVEDGSKTQTRRVVKPQPVGDVEWFGCYRSSNPKQDGQWAPMKGDPKDMDCWETAEGPQIRCPYGLPGDRLYVKESIYIDHFDYFDGPLPKAKPDLDDGMLVYRRDGTCCQQFAECECGGRGAPWRSPLFMPKWAARLWLEIVDVRVERLCECSSEDAVAEGAEAWEGECLLRKKRLTKAQLQYAELWDSIHGPGSWDLNPWVWVLQFRKAPS